MIPEEARAAFVAADEEFLAHRQTCYACGNSRWRYPPACPDGDSLRAAALVKRQVWADAVAQVRASGSSTDVPSLAEKIRREEDING